MIHDVLGSISSIWPRIGLIIFAVFFVGVVIWAYRGGRDRFEHESHLPLDDNDSMRLPSESQRTPS